MYQNISLFLGALFGQLSFYHPLNATEVNSFYPGLNDTQVLDAVICNVLFHCPTKLLLWGEALVTSGIKDVYWYTYGAKFPNLQPVNDLGVVWHGSGSSTNEIKLSKTLQTAFANFAKDPGTPSALNWSVYNTNVLVPTLAKLTYHGNVELGNGVDLVDPSIIDDPCQEWAQFLDFCP